MLWEFLTKKTLVLFAFSITGRLVLLLRGFTNDSAPFTTVELVFSPPTAKTVGVDLKISTSDLELQADRLEFTKYNVLL